jgi:hypothetical protein
MRFAINSRWGSSRRPAPALEVHLAPYQVSGNRRLARVRVKGDRRYRESLAFAGPVDEKQMLGMLKPVPTRARRELLRVLLG